MAWSASKIFSAFLTDQLAATIAIDLNNAAEVINAALFDNTITPDAQVASADSAYAAASGIWDTGGVADAPSWPAVGRPLVTKTLAFSTNVVKFDAADTVSADATTDLANVYGCLIYSDTIAAPVADQGICFIYLGGANSVVNGTFTVVWHGSGIFSLTL